MRTATRSDTALLKDALASFVVADSGARPNYSIEFATRRGALHLLRWGSCLVARERTPARLLDAVFRHLGAHARPKPGHVRLDAVLIAVGDNGILVPSSFRSFAWRVVPALADVGAELIASPHVDLDIESGRVLVPTPLPARLAAVDALVRQHSGTRSSLRETMPRPTSLAAMLIWLPGAPPGDLADLLVGLVGHQVVRPSDVPADARQHFIRSIGKISSGSGTVNDLARAVRDRLESNLM